MSGLMFYDHKTRFKVTIRIEYQDIGWDQLFLRTFMILLTIK